MKHKKRRIKLKQKPSQTVKTRKEHNAIIITKRQRTKPAKNNNNKKRKGIIIKKI